MSIKHFKEAKELWKTLVPEKGQASTVQGELIRSVERLRWEAQKNGNVNWDYGYTLFCDFLQKNLLNSPAMDETARAEIKADIERLRKFKEPYLNDDLYDRLTDRIVEFHRAVGQPISREPDPMQTH